MLVLGQNLDRTVHRAVADVADGTGVAGKLGLDSGVACDFVRRLRFAGEDQLGPVAGQVGSGLAEHLGFEVAAGRAFLLVNDDQRLSAKLRLAAEEDLLHFLRVKVGNGSIAFEVEVGDEVAAVVRESLSNAVRHARASSVAVSIAVRGAHVTVTVSDDGVGIGPQSITSTPAAANPASSEASSM